MPPIESSIKTLQELSKKYAVNIVIATSRENCTDSWSINWLRKNNVPYNRIVNTRSEGKAKLDVDILIDDYILNINEFIRNGPPNRQAILFAQPWNQDTSTINDLIEKGKVKIAHSWQVVLSILKPNLIEASPVKKSTKSNKNTSTWARAFYSILVVV